MEYYTSEPEPFNFFLSKPPEKGKKLFLYQNGKDKAFKTFVYNSRNVRDFGSFLNQVTTAVDAPAAVRHIYTPHEGHRVRSLDTLKDGGSYVVGGKEVFKQVSYGMGHRPRVISLRKSLDTTSLALPPLPPLPKQIIAQARFLENVNKPIVIIVYRNGELQHKGNKILLTPKELTSWERVLEIITDKTGLFAPARRVHTIEGKKIKFLTDFEHQGRYVAIESNRHFKKLPYGAIEMLSTQSPLKISRPIGSHPILMRRKRLVYRPNVKSEASIPNVMTSLPQAVPLQPIIIPERNRKISLSKQRPLGGRRDKEKREIEKFKFKVREDSAFAPSTATLIQTERLVNSPDEHESVVYPNSVLPDDSLNASQHKQEILKENLHYPLAEGEVEDAPGLITEKPVDLMPTEEVREESVMSQNKHIASTIPVGNSIDASLKEPIEHVDVKPMEGNGHEHTQLQSDPTKSDLEETQPSLIDNIDTTNPSIVDDSIEGEKDGTFDKSDVSVADNIPVISSKNQEELNFTPTDPPHDGNQESAIGDTITNEQVIALEYQQSSVNKNTQGLSENGENVSESIKSNGNSGSSNGTVEQKASTLETDVSK